MSEANDEKLDSFARNPRDLEINALGKAWFRPRFRLGEHVDGWVEGEIRVLYFPGTPGSYRGTPNVTPAFYVGTIPFYDKSKDMVYVQPTPPSWGFVFLIYRYPSGFLTDYEMNNWTIDDFDYNGTGKIFNDDRGADENTLTEASDLRKVIDEYLLDSQKRGWERSGHGKYWYSYRLRKKYDQLLSPIKWR